MPFSLSSLPILVLLAASRFVSAADDTAVSGTFALPQVALPFNTTDTHAIPAQFGNPPQFINLIISTTSSKSWVYSKAFCSSLNATTRRAQCEGADTAASGGSALFDETQSSNWKQKDTAFSYSSSNNQQDFKGILGSDVVTIGGITIPNLEFGVVTQAESPDASTLTMTGLDGGIGGVLGVGEGSPYLKYLMEKKLISGNSIAVQLAINIAFTDEAASKTAPNRRIVPYDNPDTSVSGSILFGGFDANRFQTNDSAASNLSKDGEIMTTITMMTSTWFDGANDNNPSFSTEFKSDTGASTVIDSTSPFILIPESYWAQMDPQWSRGAINTTTGRTYYTDPSGHRDWRNFTFTLYDAEKKQSRQLTLQHFDWNIWDPEVNFWAPAFKLQPKGVETVVLGRPAMRALYAQVDWDKRTAKTVPVTKRGNLPKAKIEKTNAASGRVAVGAMVWALAGVAVAAGVFF
ncbi:aspartic peptidase domain-containing protein [Peziza echinospora]|nr:aspartic peptidase domain-containing protein [Peziza echinospora]